MSLTAAEQYLLELINRARLDPQAEANRYGVGLNSGLQSGTIDGSAKQVLAPNTRLESAAASHSQWMLNADTFSHTGAGGSNPGERMTSAGYQFSGSWTWRENLAWTGSTGSISLSRAIEQHHEGLYRSAGHRANTFAEDIREIGVAQVSGKFTYQGNTYNASMLTEKFAKSGSEVYITGVSYNDSDGDRFYSIGEGRGGVWVRADGEVDQTASAGGYAIGVSADEASAVRVGINASTFATLTIDTTEGNAKLDMVRLSNGSWVLETSADVDLTAGIPNARLLGADHLELRGSGGNNLLAGNKGNNFIAGGDGQDRLFGSNGHDRIFGGDHADYIAGGNHNDRIWGQNGNDFITGGWGADILSGGYGADVLLGGGGNDLLAGNFGNDRMAGGAGADQFIFNHGDDRIVDFQNDVDVIKIVRGVAGPGATVNSILNDSRVVNGNLVLDLANGHSLTVEGVTNANILANDLVLI